MKTSCTLYKWWCIIFMWWTGGCVFMNYVTMFHKETVFNFVAMVLQGAAFVYFAHGYIWAKKSLGEKIQ